jgi:hypothetical protein
MLRSRPVLLVLALAGGFLAACVSAGTTARTAPPDPAAPPALDAIMTDEIHRDLFALAGDEMRGREAGTLDELRASAYYVDLLNMGRLDTARITPEGVGAIIGPNWRPPDGPPSDPARHYRASIY